jgi:hypothetical protein
MHLCTDVFYYFRPIPELTYDNKPISKIYIFFPKPLQWFEVEY